MWRGGASAAAEGGVGEEQGMCFRRREYVKCRRVDSVNGGVGGGCVLWVVSDAVREMGEGGGGFCSLIPPVLDRRDSWRRLREGESDRIKACIEAIFLWVLGRQRHKGRDYFGLILVSHSLALAFTTRQTCPCRRRWPLCSC